MMMFAPLMLLLSTASANPGWQAGPDADASAARATDVSCRREAVDAAPGQSLSIDWARHRACMEAAGFVAVAVQQREVRILARAERRRSRAEAETRIADTEETPPLHTAETALGIQ